MNHDLAARLADLAGDLYATSSLDDLLTTVARAAPGLVGCGHASIVLAGPDGALEPIVASGPVMEKADQLQLEFGQGPLLSALAGQGTIAVADLLAETRWPRWIPKAAELGVRSSLSVPLRFGNATLGVLTLADDSPAALHHHADGAALLLARHTCVAIATARRHVVLGQVVTTEQLIAQACGILMERYRLTIDQAAAVLRHDSHNGDVSLREAAQDLIATRRLTPNGGRPHVSDHHLHH